MEFVFISSKVNKTKNNQPYVQVESFDIQGTNRSINIWGLKSLQTPCFAKIINLSENAGFLSCNCSDVKFYKEIPQEFLKYLPKVISDKEFFNLGSSCKDIVKSDLEKSFISYIFPYLYDLYKDRTAARGNHHAYKGGLLQHTSELVSMFVSIYKSLPFSVDPFVVIVSCLFHDFGKIDEYTNTNDYNDSFFLKGHPFISAESVGKVLNKFGFDKHVIDHVQHCVLAHHGRLEFGSPVVPCTTEAFLVSKLDELSGHGVMLEKVGSKFNNTTVLKY